MDGAGPPPKPTRPDRAVLHPMLRSRPRKRSQCIDGPRPCPWVSCRHHLAVDVVAGGQVLVRASWDDDSSELQGPSCSLDLAAAGPQWISTVGGAMGFGDTRMLQIEREALMALHRLPLLQSLHADLPDHHDGEAHAEPAPDPYEQEPAAPRPKVGAQASAADQLRLHLLATGGLQPIYACRIHGVGILRSLTDADLRAVACRRPDWFRMVDDVVELVIPTIGQLQAQLEGTGARTAAAETAVIAAMLSVNLVAAGLWRERVLAARGALRGRRAH